MSIRAARPNILLILADQLAAPALPFYGHAVVQAPQLAALAAEGVVFENAYCNSPLCAPSRFSLLSGQLPSRLGAYDNAAEHPAAVPTLAHYLRDLGYQTSLAGKMHFVGPDQLHGFEERLTTDIYPSDFGWTPDWERPDERVSWYHNMLSVVQAGLCVTSNQLDYDEEVAFRSVRKLYELARSSDDRPFLLTVSFTHPHDPFAVTRAYWDRYAHDRIPLPAVGPIPVERLDPHSRRIRAMCAMDEFDITAEHVRNARHAYFGAISYVDDKVGELLRALEAIDRRQDTIVIFLSDHGEMLGERGLWYKMTFFEWAARVPLLFNAPGRFAARRVPAPVSLVDLLPTLVDLASDGQRQPEAAAVDGQSLVPLLAGDDRPVGPVLSEYLAEGVTAPVLMLRRGRYKYIYSEPDPDQLFDLEADPLEAHNLAGQPEHAAVQRAMCDAVLRRWDPAGLRQRVLESQQRRRLVARALMRGTHTAWDYQPVFDASQAYMRNHLDLNDLERRARYPAPPTPEPRPG